MIRAALTVEEALEGMKALEPKIKNYARLVVRKGVNVKPGQEVVVQSPVECAPFARVVVAEAYASGELKHGTISLIRQGTPVIAVAAYLPLLDKAVSNVVEVQARGARVLALTTEAGAEALHKRVDTVLTVPEAEAMLLPQLGVIPLQLLSYYTALERGCDIDKPRNLAKSVTVE